MIDASMYTINNFSPADFIGGTPDAGFPIGGLSGSGGPYSSETAPGKSFREYLASLTSAAETYSISQEEERHAVRSGAYGRSAGDQAEYSAQNASEDGTAVARSGGRTSAEQAARESANGTEPEEKLRKDENQNQRTGENSRSGSGTERGQASEAGDTDASKKADTDQAGTEQNTAAAGNKGKKDGAAAAEREGRIAAGKMQQEGSSRIRRGEEEAAADLNRKLRPDENASESAAADQVMKAGAAAAAGAADKNIRRMEDQREGERLHSESRSADGRRMKGDGTQRIAGGTGRDESARRPKITVVDTRRKTGRAGGRSGEGQAERVSERSGRSADRAGTAGRTQNQEFRLVSSQSSGTAQGLQTDQNGSPQQAFHVLVRSEGSESFQAPLSKGDNSADLQNQLVKQLREQLNSEIVKRGSIMVRNNGSGEIRLELKPDHLGQVKIHLSLENNNIAGRILVENISVKEAFDQNMQELYRSFKEHGFGDTALNVSVGNQRRQKNAHKDANGIAGGSGSTSLQAIEAEQSRTLQPTGEQRLVDVLA